MDESGGCPVTAAEMMQLLKENDADNCSFNEGNRTRLVSEEAQILGQDNAEYRAVTSRRCGGRQEFGLVFSMFGFSGQDPDLFEFDSDEEREEAEALHVSGSGLPGGVEVISFSDGVFNYYKEVDGVMGFFGSSHDYVLEGPGGPNLTDTRGCANCHTGGGPIMKELEAPWLHWTGSINTPGHNDLINNRTDVMGAVANGINLETAIVKPGNSAWNETRIEIMKDQGVAELLKPLFCPVEVNLRSGSRTNIPSDFFADPTIPSRRSISIDGADYDNVIAAIGQHVPFTGPDFELDSKTDTARPFTFLERAHGDKDYVNKLVSKEIIDRQFVLDVLMVDFTRPVLSDARCDLLEFAPDLDTDELSPEAIRDGFIDNLAGSASGSAAGQLLAHLEASQRGSSFDHRATSQGFFDACRARQGDDNDKLTIDVDGSDVEVAAFTADVIRLRSLQRKIAVEDSDLCSETEGLSSRNCLDSLDGSASHLFRVFEFQRTMAFDLVKPSRSADTNDVLEIHPEARLSPVDCTLITEFSAAGTNPGGGDEPTASVCEGRCGDFISELSCGCDAECSRFGNCCDGFETVCPQE
jgi:hypothetical protein